MRSIKLLVATVLAALITTAADASNAGGGYVHHILAFPNGVVLFQQTGARGTPPSCGAGLATRWALDATTASGQARLAVLLTAYSLHKQIEIVGTGACQNWGDTESVDYLVTTNDN